MHYFRFVYYNFNIRTVSVLIIFHYFIIWCTIFLSIRFYSDHCNFHLYLHNFRISNIFSHNHASIIKWPTKVRGNHQNSDFSWQAVYRCEGGQPNYEICFFRITISASEILSIIISCGLVVNVALFLLHCRYRSWYLLVDSDTRLSACPQTCYRVTIFSIQFIISILYIIKSISDHSGIIKGKYVISLYLQTHRSYFIYVLLLCYWIIWFHILYQYFLLSLPIYFFLVYS